MCSWLRREIVGELDDVAPHVAGHGIDHRSQAQSDGRPDLLDRLVDVGEQEVGR